MVIMIIGRGLGMFVRFYEDQLNLYVLDLEKYFVF